MPLLADLASFPLHVLRIPLPHPPEHAPPPLNPPTPHDQIWLGGNQNQTRLAELYADRIKVKDLEAFLEPILMCFKAARKQGERFGDFVSRIGLVELKRRTGVDESATPSSASLALDPTTLKALEALARAQVRPGSRRGSRGEGRRGERGGGVGGNGCPRHVRVCPCGGAGWRGEGERWQIVQGHEASLARGESSVWYVAPGAGGSQHAAEYLSF